ncbi:MAG: hypothetical protein NTY77_14220 [Elusimicrobia bacterium]|nr:hypothetical protein [Elusimicrobiota bacterium]
MKRLMAAAFFVMLMGAISCSSDPCQQSGGCGGSSSSSSSNCNSNTSTGLNCSSGYHQVGTGSSAYCVRNQ